LGLLAHLLVRGRRRPSARFYFATLAVVFLIPTLLISWWLASLSAASERAEIERNILQEADDISAFFDREVVSIRSILIALAGSPYLQSRDFESFHRQASEVARKLNIQIILRDRQIDKQLINTGLPWGTNLANGIPAPLSGAEEELLRSGRPFVSNIFWGPLVHRFVVAVILPVAIDGDLEYFLSVGIPVERFTEIIRHMALSADIVTSVFDRNGIIVTRSERKDEFVGKPVRTVLDVFDLKPLRSVVMRLGLDGITYHSGHVRSELTGWTVAVGIPEGVLRANSNRTLAGFGGVGTIIVLIAMVGAHQIGGRFSESFGALGIDRRPTSAEFNVLFEHAPNGVVVVDGGGTIVLINVQMEAMFGFSRDELIGEPVETLMPESLHIEHSALRKDFARAAQARPMGAGRDLFGRRKDGSEFPIEIGLNPISIPAGKLIMATVVDITKRKRAAEKLSTALAERDDFRRRFLQAQEDERLRLAHELHDQTGQSLTAVMLELKDIESMSDGCERDRLRLLRLQMEQMGKALHHVAWELRPASLDELGLASALANYAAEWSEQYGIESDFHCADPEIDELSNEMRTTIYRIVQEGLTNIAKHARTATAVSVVIDRVGETVVMTIEDDGSGFDVTVMQSGATGKRSGLGLAGMRERLSLVGGEFQVESSVGIGTTVFARIPLSLARTAA